MPTPAHISLIEEGYHLLPTADATPAQSDRWLGQVRSLLDSLTAGEAPEGLLPADIPDLIEAYDLLHRVRCGYPCDAYLRRLRLALADRWLRPDRWLRGPNPITKTDIVLQLLAEVDRDILTLPRRYTDFALHTLSTWITDLLRHGRFTDLHHDRFADLQETQLTEAYARLIHLLPADLFAFIPPAEEPHQKRRWTAAYLPTEPAAFPAPASPVPSLSAPAASSAAARLQRRRAAFLRTARLCGCLPPAAKAKQENSINYVR